MPANVYNQYGRYAVAGMPGRFQVAALPGRYQVGRAMQYARQRYRTGANLYNGGPCGVPPVCPPGDPICDTAKRRLPLGFFSAAVAAGATVNVVAQPQLVFRPDQLIVPAALAGFFTVDQIIIGTRPQLVAVAPVPAEVYTQASVNNQLVLDTAQPGIDITLSVTNIDAAVHDFRAALIGFAISQL